MVCKEKNHVRFEQGSHSIYTIFPPGLSQDNILIFKDTICPFLMIHYNYNIAGIALI